MTIPLVYIHNGYSWYLPLVLANGLGWHHGSVHFVGNRFGCWVAALFGARVHPIETFQESAASFVQLYRHHSALGEDFERFCIGRWFILRDFMVAQEMASCIYLDSDILITSDLGGLVDRTSGFPMAYTGFSAHCVCVNERSGLDRFCNWVVDFYRDPANEPRMQAWLATCLADSGSSGMSDMVLFHWFHQDFPDQLVGFDSLYSRSPIDVSLADTTGYQDDGRGFKLIRWIRRRAFAVSEGGDLHELVVLHHQGRAKALIRANARELGFSWFTTDVLTRVLDLFFRIQRKFHS
jgi:hypothetical protein